MPRVACAALLALTLAVVGMPSTSAGADSRQPMNEMAATASTQTAPDGGYVLDGWGGVHPFGGAPAVKRTAYWYGWDIARGIAWMRAT